MTVQADSVKTQSGILFTQDREKVGAPSPVLPELTVVPEQEKPQINQRMPKLTQRPSTKTYLGWLLIIVVLCIHIKKTLSKKWGNNQHEEETIVSTTPYSSHTGQ
ncbi:hypothetical protein [Enterococcus sp. DIV0876]|uniref:hypothetical protein n=1 Tax=Enterococcus sp. DIV0876 TaxID=2774633 RepID=UPI003D2FB9A7